MAKLLVIASLILLLFTANIFSDDLYKVKIRSQNESDQLRSIQVEPVFKLGDGYLILADENQIDQLENSTLEIDLLKKSITLNQIGLDVKKDNSNKSRLPLLYEENSLRLFEVDFSQVNKSTIPDGIAPIINNHLEIYFEKTQTYFQVEDYPTDIQQKIDLIVQDSIEALSLELQTYGYRPAGSIGNATSRNWEYGKFLEYGYDSVHFERFNAEISGENTLNYNVHATKIGTVFPKHKIIIGAHRDGVVGSPGGDDNGSGTVAVLEMARVLKDYDSKFTIEFILFDAEEYGLHGAYYDAGLAADNGDSIIFMLNMDMIAHYQNNSQADIFYNSSSLPYAELWAQLADSLTDINITAVLGTAGAGSDHYPYMLSGFDAIFVHEYIFSNVYHSYRDSTSYMNFNYHTRMVKASLATAYVVDNTYSPQPTWFSFVNNEPEYIVADSIFPIDLLAIYFGEDYFIPGSFIMNYSISGASFVSVPMSQFNDTVFSASFPMLSCGDNLLYNFTAEDNNGITYYFPIDSTYFNAGVGTGIELVFEDDFDTDKGWSVSGNATDGDWERSYPPGWSGSPSEDFDNSGYCYNTDKAILKDVDDGYTTLASPFFNLSGTNGLIQYALWYSNDESGTPNEDVLKVELFVDNNWIPVDSLGPIENASGGWNLYQFWTNQFTLISNSMKVRFIASDYGDDSHVEASLDAFAVWEVTCAPDIATNNLTSWTVNQPYNEFIKVYGGEGTLSYIDLLDKLNGSGLSITTDGFVTGTPLIDTTYSIVVKVIDSNGDISVENVNLTLNPEIEIVSDTMPKAFLGLAYSDNLNHTGGTAPFTWIDKNNDLDATGLTILSDGKIEGTPALLGEISFTAQITDASGAVVEKLIILDIGEYFVCADIDNNGFFDISDITYLVDYLFLSGPPIAHEQAADVDNSGMVDIADLTWLVDYLFSSGIEPNCPEP